MQLIKQIKDTILVFKYTYPNCIGVFMFNRSSAHKGFAEDALNTNSMNVNPKGKQKRMCDTISPLNNLDPAPNEEDICGQVQQMCLVTIKIQSAKRKQKE